MIWQVAVNRGLNILLSEIYREVLVSFKQNLKFPTLFFLCKTHFQHTSLVVFASHSHTVQSRTLQNFQDPHTLHVSDPLFSAVDEAEPAEWELDDITAQIGKLELNQDRPTSQSVPQNSSQEERMGHFHIDPITGHIATVTLDPRGTANMRPHADGMWGGKSEEKIMNERRERSFHHVSSWNSVSSRQENIWGWCLHRQGN